MKKQLSTEKSISLRIILLAPPSGVDFGIQEGKGSNYKTIQVQRSEDTDIKPHETDLKRLPSCNEASDSLRHASAISTKLSG